MSNLGSIQKLYIDLLEKALLCFYKTDAKDLFANNSDTDERAMVACVFHYMKRLRNLPKYSGLEPNIDLEYNRMIDSKGKRDCKVFNIFPACDHCDVRVLCSDVIGWKKDDLDYTHKCEDCKKNYFRPDLIAHRRNSKSGHGNGLVVEFKKANVANTNMEFDKAKMLACTCKKGDFRYKVGAFVILGKESASICVFSNHKCVTRDTIGCAGNESRNYCETCRICQFQARDHSHKATTREEF